MLATKSNSSWLTLFLCLLTPTYAFTATNQAAIIAPKETLMALTVNDQDVNRVAIMLFIDNRWLISETDLNFLHWKIPHTPTTQYNDQNFYALSAFKDLEYKVDTQKMRLQLDAPVKLYIPTKIHQETKWLQPVKSEHWGAYLNYDAISNHSSTFDNNASGLFTLTAFNRWGSLRQGVITSVFEHDHSSAYRLETTFTHERPSAMAHFRVGDVNNATGLWGNSLLLGGIQYTRDFNMQPHYQPYPAIRFNGEARLPSTVDLYLNNARLYRRNMPPGEFEIDQLPHVNGAGTVQVVTRDLLGREYIAKLPFYATSDLLQPGVHEFSYEAGFSREDFASDDDRYSEFTAVATDRFGITNKLTGEWHIEFRDKTQAVGFTASHLFADWAVITAGIAHSEYHYKPGNLAILGIERSESRYSFGARAQWTSYDFMQLASFNNNPPIVQAQAFFSMPLWQDASFSTSYVGRRNRHQSDQSFLNANISQRLFKDIYIRLNSQFDLSKHGNNAFFASINYHFTNRTTGNISWSDRSHTRNTTATLSHRPAGYTGWGYQLRASDGEFGEEKRAELSYHPTFGRFSAQAQSLDEDEFYRFNAQGALAYLDDQFFATRSIYNSFAVVAIPGYSDIDVFHGSMKVDHTNRNGYAIIPNLTPYRENIVRINGKNLPLDLDVAKLSELTIPYDQSGVVVHFDAKPAFGALLNLVTPDGTPIEAGSIVQDVETMETFPVAYEGRTYITGLKPGQVHKLMAHFHGESCYAQVNLTETDEPIPELGEITCLPTNKNVSATPEPTHAQG